MSKVILESARRYEATLDVDKFIGAFGSEWADWMGSDIAYATDDDKIDFINESVHVMGAEDFILEVKELGGTVTWDDDLAVSVHP